ncbi:hypothetical protein ISF_01243 [Cordyceps fumosorosea ARSEF 2679]|uniref:Uncharacterized protein n=1 Tax=Cordyceps fumosorosea (strain ARSEF 2679) TaxID=1081104 RepID=A0A168D4V2_CORFA|nr:hypothetical protein ISF_01243 [Cordyceps fumosorosea ARSEF 2679]OAA72170.1 hypothetical protein ISF_01243 [Cordyceps fumosorosea ARSEF 2679]
MRPFALFAAFAAGAMGLPAQIFLNPGIPASSRKLVRPHGYSSMYAKVHPVDEHILVYNCTELAPGGSLKCHETRLDTTLSDLLETAGGPTDSLLQTALVFAIAWLCAYLVIDLALFYVYGKEATSEKEVVITLRNGRVPDGDHKTNEDV